MLNPNVHRRWTGIYIEGQEIGIEVLPHADGRLAVHVIAQPAVTGFSQACRLSESRNGFLPSEIVVSDARLDCFEADHHVPYYRVGFTVVLEPGMAHALRLWLPKLTRVATVAQAIVVQFDKLLDEPFHHMQEAITNVVARVVLADWDVEHSISFERKESCWKNEAVFMAMFDQAAVRVLLESAVAKSGTTAPSE